MKELHLIVENNIQELTSIGVSLESFFEQHELPLTLLFDTNLVIEELFSNVVFYAFPEGGSHPVHISLMLKPHELIVRMEDDGIAFDPTNKEDPDDLDKPLEEREIGGLGIHLVKKMMTSVQYSRENNKNVLILTREY